MLSEGIGGGENFPGKACLNLNSPPPYFRQFGETTPILVGSNISLTGTDIGCEDLILVSFM